MKKYLYHLLSITICLSSCSKSKMETAKMLISAPTGLKAQDLGNMGNILDLTVSFNKPKNTDLIEEFRVFIVKQEQSEAFDSLEALNQKNYLSLNKTASSSSIKFTESQLDTDEDLVEEGVAYNIFALSYASDPTLGGVLSAPSAITLTQNNLVRTLTNISGGTGGMDVDKDGNIYMADFGATTGGNPWGTKVYKITPEGEVSLFASGFNGASGNDFDDDGNLFQSNISGNSISKVSPSGEVSEFASGLSSPVGVVVAPDGSLFVCNCTGNTIGKVSPEGTVSTFASSALFNCPNGIDMDNAGNLYVANFGSANLVKITPDGQASLLTTLPGINNGHLLIHGNYIYLISRGLNQIHRVTFSGHVSLFAGSGSRGIVDGPLLDAGFSLPNDLAFSPDGKKIYLNDVDGNNSDPTIINPVVIRVIELVD